MLRAICSSFSSALSAGRFGDEGRLHPRERETAGRDSPNNRFQISFASQEERFTDSLEFAGAFFFADFERIGFNGTPIQDRLRSGGSDRCSCNFFDGIHAVQVFENNFLFWIFGKRCGEKVSSAHGAIHNAVMGFASAIPSKHNASVSVNDD
jgi:hypothetical protein